MRKAPGSGMVHYCHGVACVLLHRPEEALSHLKTAERLMPGWHLMWAVTTWQFGPNFELGRWVEGAAAVDESIRLNPTHAFNHVAKARISMHFGRDAEGRRHIETARRMGVDLAQAERIWRRAWPNSPTLEDDIAIIRAVYAATEPGA